MRISKAKVKELLGVDVEGLNCSHPLIGKRFGDCVVKSFAFSKKLTRGTLLMFNYMCDCGNEFITSGTNLKRGDTKSCGCWRQKHKKVKNIKLYNIYYSMITRCYNPNRKFWHCYGGRGITVCKEWIDDFTVFQKWAYENGYKEGLSIERINVNGNYEPKNCCWIPLAEQHKNTRSIHYLTFNGKKQSMSEWARKLDIPITTIYSRIQRGKSIEEVLEK